MESRVQRVLDDEHIDQLSSLYRAWRTRDASYEDIPGLCKSATLAEIEGHDFVLTPGRYVGVEDLEDDNSEPFPERFARLAAKLNSQMTRGAHLDATIKKSLDCFEYDLD